MSPSPTSPRPAPPAVNPASLVTGPGSANDSLAQERARTRAGEERSEEGTFEGLVLSERELNGFHVDLLHELATELNIEGRSSMRKDELVAALVGSD